MCCTLLHVALSCTLVVLFVILLSFSGLTVFNKERTVQQNPFSRVIVLQSVETDEREVTVNFERKNVSADGKGQPCHSASTGFHCSNC